MKKRYTDYGLTETFITALANWMEHGTVDVNKFSQRYHKAIITQYNIGWNQIFMGRISQEWLQLYEDSYKRPPDCKKKKHFFDGYVWGASLVEKILQQVIHLWEQRNKDVHGKTDPETEAL